VRRTIDVIDPPKKHEERRIKTSILAAKTAVA
jgi:hypothetical protein